MLSVLVTTARAAKCFTHHPDWDQFDVLARWLERQTFRDFELVVVTPFPDDARATLSGRVERLTIVPPRNTPWRRERMFAVASARNTGLVHARGDWILTLDDACEFEPDFLGRVAGWADHGCGVSVMYRKNGEIIDGRWSMFEQAARGGESVIIRGQDHPVPYGYIAFPLAAAIAINGYDELRFDGARGLEDMNFARRLMVHGVPFAMDRRIFASLHDTIGYPEEIIANEEQNARCCNTAHVLSQMGPANRARYTTDEKRQVLNCKFWRDDGKCGYHSFRHACAYPSWAKDGHPVARRILLGDEEELFDLAVARQAVGFS